VDEIAPQPVAPIDNGISCMTVDATGFGLKGVETPR
jgi:hypothetical protein